MATLEEIMLELKSQEGDDKKEGFSNALLGQVTPTTPSEAGNKLLSPFGLSLGEQQPQPFGPVNQQAQPISILGQAPATPSGAVNQLRDEYRLAFADQQAQLNAQAQAQPLGPQSPFLPSGEKAVYAMTPEEVAARQAGRNRLMDDSMIGSLANLVGDLVLGKNRGVSSSSPLSTNLPPTFTPPSEGANPISDSIGRLFGFTKDREPISLVELGLESPQQAALREQFNPTQTLITPTFNSGVQAEPSTQPSDTLQTGQVTPTIQSITGVEQAQEQALQPETTTTPSFEGLNPVGIGMGDGKEFSSNTLSRGITPTSTFGGDLDLAARYADSISGVMGTPMTGMRPIDPNTGEPLSQQVIDIANRIGLQLPEASVPLAPQAPMSPRDLAVAEGEARLERIRSGQGLSDTALIATGKMEAPEGYYDRPTEAPVPGQSTMTVGEQAQANFERFKASGQKMTPEQVVQAKNLAASSGRTFNEETGYSKEFNPAIQAAYLARQSPTDGQGSGLTTVGGASLSEFLGGAAMPKQGYGMRTDAQGRMINPNVDRSDFNIASAYRENVLAARPDFMRAVSDRERRGTGEMSRSEATRIAESQGYKGQQARDVADGYITLQRQGRDPMTGKEVEAPFEPKEIEISGNKYIQLTPNYFQPIKEDTPGKTGLQSSLDDLQADFQSGRLTKEQFDLAVENITNTYIGRNKEKPGGGVVSEVEKIIAAGKGDSVDSTFTPQQEAGIEAVMNANKITREAAIQALKDAGKLN